MSLSSGRSAKRMAPLNVWVIASALVLAAFAGGGLGLVWQSSSWAQGDQDSGDEEEAADES